MSDNKKLELQVNIQDLKNSDDEHESQYGEQRTREKLDASYADYERQPPEDNKPDLNDKDDDYETLSKSLKILYKDQYVKKFQKNFSFINSKKTLVDCKSEFQCYLINNQEVVGFDKDQSLKKISLIVKEKQGEELICKQILLQAKFTELLKKANEILKEKQETNTSQDIKNEKKDGGDEKEQDDNKSEKKEEEDDNKPEEEKKDNEKVTSFRLSTNKQELLFGTSLGKVIQVNLETFQVIFVYQIKKQLGNVTEKKESSQSDSDDKKEEISDIDSNDKMIVCIYNKTKVYRIMKNTDNQLKGPIIKKIKSVYPENFIFQVSPYSNHFILQQEQGEEGALFDSEKLLFEKIQSGTQGPVSLLLGCFLENQSFAYFQNHKDLEIIQLNDEKETYKKENIMKGLYPWELQFDKDNKCLTILEFNNTSASLHIKILDLQGNELKPTQEVIKAKGMKYPGVKFYLRLYDGTKICNTNEPTNSFLDEILSFSINDSNYFGQIDNQPFIYQIHDNILLQKEFKGIILSSNHKNFIALEKNNDKANEYSESQTKIESILNQESFEFLGATHDYQVIFRTEIGQGGPMDSHFNIFYNLQEISNDEDRVQQVQIESDKKSYLSTGMQLKQLVIKTEGSLDQEVIDISHRLGKLIIQREEIREQAQQATAMFQIEKIKLTQSKKSLIFLSKNKIAELDLQNEQTEAQQYILDFNTEQNFKIIDFEIFEDDEHFCITNDESEILICKIDQKVKEDKKKQKVNEDKKEQEGKKLKEINKILIHKKELVYCYYLNKKRAVSIGYEDSNNLFKSMPNKEKPIEMFYWDITDQKNWKKLFSFDNKQIKIINDHRCIPEAFILDGQIRLFSQAEKEFAIDFSKFDLSHDQRIFGPYLSKFFFQRVKILTDLKDENEIEQQLNQLGQFVVYPQGFTLLGYLVLEKETRLVKQLLNCENVKFVKDFTNSTPLTHALAIKNFEIINLLLEFIHKRPNLITIVDAKELTQILKLQPEKWPLLLANSFCEIEQDVDLAMLEDAEKSYLEEDLHYPKYKQHTQELIDKLTNLHAKIEDKKQVIVKQTLIPVDIMHGSAETTMLLREIQLFENQDIYKQEFIINLIQYKWESINRINDFFLILQIIQTFVIWIHSYKPGERLYLFIMLISSFIYFVKELIICVRLHQFKQDFKKKSSGQNQQIQQSLQILSKGFNEKIQGVKIFTAFTSWLAVLVFLLQTTYTLTNLISVNSYVDYILPILNLASWIVLVQELGTFKIVLKFHIIFLLSVKGLSGFILYFGLMLVSFSTTQGILKKTLLRVEKIGSESQPTSPQFYKMHNAFMVDEKISQDFFDNIQFVWKAIMSGEYEIEGHEDVFIRVYGWFTALLANVILLNLIVAIMGDTYEESITSMNEKIMREQVYRIVRHQCFFIGKEKEEKCLIWMQYVDQVGQTWVSQADMISSTVKNAFKKVFKQIITTEDKQKDQLTKIENKMQEQLIAQKADSKKLDELKTALSADKKKAEEVKEGDSVDNKDSNEVKEGDLADNKKVDKIQVSKSVDGLKLADFQTDIKNNLAEMKAQVAQGQTQAIEIQAQQTKMQAQQTEMQTQVVDIKSQVAEMNSQVAEIKSQLTEFINYMKEQK